MAEQIAFVSGHLDISVDEFEAHYKPFLDHAASKNHGFIIGSAEGADRMSMRYLIENKKGAKVQCTVFERNPAKRAECITFCRANEIPMIEALWKTYEERDAYMTYHSTYDITWVRSPEDCKQLYGKRYRPNRVSGTEKNILRRRNLNLNNVNTK